MPEKGGTQISELGDQLALVLTHKSFPKSYILFFCFFFRKYKEPRAWIEVQINYGRAKKRKVSAGKLQVWVQRIVGEEKRSFYGRGYDKVALGPGPKMVVGQLATLFGNRSSSRRGSSMQSERAHGPSWQTTLVDGPNGPTWRSWQSIISRRHVGQSSLSAIAAARKREKSAMDSSEG